MEADFLLVFSSKSSQLSSFSTKYLRKSPKKLKIIKIKKCNDKSDFTEIAHTSLNNGV